MTHRYDYPLQMGDVTNLMSTITNLQASQVQVVSTNSDVSTSGTSATDATGLGFVLASGQRYMGQMHIRFQSNNVLGGLQLSMNGPATTEAIEAAIRVPSSLSVIVPGVVTAYDALIGATGIDTINTDRLAIIEFSLKPSANGTLITRFARGGAAGTVTIKAGSMGILIPVA